MGKKKKKSGTPAGKRAKTGNIQAQNQEQSPESMEISLQKRSRFSTEHLKQLETLYREGLNLEDEILAEAELSDEELQGTLDELETIQNTQNSSGYSSEEVKTPGGSGENRGTEDADGAVQEERTVARKAQEERVRGAETRKEISVETAIAGEASEGILLEELTEAGITLEELAAAGITPEKTASEQQTFGKTTPEEDSTVTAMKKAASEEPAGEETEWKDLPWQQVPEEPAGEETEWKDLPWQQAPEEPAAEETEWKDLPWQQVSEESPGEETGSIESASEELSEEILTAEELAPLLEESETEKPEAAREGKVSAVEKTGSGDDSDGSGSFRAEFGLSKKTRMIQIAVFFAALFGISIVGLCMPLRPTESQIEKRTLTEFPEFTLESFLSGDYTDQISTWYADTFPFRETLLGWYTNFKKLFGIQGNEVYIGDVIVADDIPDIPDEDETTALATDTDATDTDAAEETTAETQETQTETATETQTETTTEAPTETTAEAPTETATEAQTTTSGGSDSSVTGEQIGSVYIYGDQAFSVYGFSLERSDNYAKMISLAAEELAGKATVYNILVPLSYGIQLDSDLWESMGWSDEEKAIRYMYSQMSGDVKTVSIYQTLLDHKDEYIYFRTDHHWTALGAYYAYQCFASVKGVTASSLDSFETMTFENYLGSLYSQSNESETLANNPDTITAYVPRGTNRMTITQKDGSILDWRVIYDVTTWRSDSKYSCFIGGDNPFSVIENPEITDGSSVLLVKESFGNAFAPFLVDHYQYVYIIDFRYYSGHLEEVVDTYGIQDVIFMNNLNSAGGTLQNYLQTFIEP